MAPEDPADSGPEARACVEYSRSLGSQSSAPYQTPRPPAVTERRRQSAVSGRQHNYTKHNNRIKQERLETAYFRQHFIFTSHLEKKSSQKYSFDQIQFFLLKSEEIHISCEILTLV